MPETINNPVLIPDVDGPSRDDFTPSRAFAVLASIQHKNNVVRSDIATLALIYAYHFSPIYTPFKVDVDTLYALERENLISIQWNNGSVRKVTVHNA